MNVLLLRELTASPLRMARASIPVLVVSVCRTPDHESADTSTRSRKTQARVFSGPYATHLKTLSIASASLMPCSVSEGENGVPNSCSMDSFSNNPLPPFQISRIKVLTDSSSPGLDERAGRSEMRAWRMVCRRTGDSVRKVASRENNNVDIVPMISGLYCDGRVAELQHHKQRLSSACATDINKLPS